MSSIPRPAALAAASAVAGAILFGVAAGGVASVDGELRAAAAPSERLVRTVGYRPETARPAWDCPDHDRAPAGGDRGRDWGEV